jgi:hypothetical protein
MQGSGSPSLSLAVTLMSVKSSHYVQGQQKVPLPGIGKLLGLISTHSDSFALPSSRSLCVVSLSADMIARLVEWTAASGNPANTPRSRACYSAKRRIKVPRVLDGQKLPENFPRGLRSLACKTYRLFALRCKQAQTFFLVQCSLIASVNVP